MEVTPERIDAARDAARRVLILASRLSHDAPALHEASIPADEKDAALVAKFYDLRTAIGEAEDAMPSDILDFILLAAGPGGYDIDGKDFHLHANTAHEAARCLAIAALGTLVKGFCDAQVASLSLFLPQPIPRRRLLPMDKADALEAAFGVELRAPDDKYVDGIPAMIRLIATSNCGRDVVLAMLRGESEQSREAFWEVVIGEFVALARNQPGALKRSIDSEWAVARRALAADGMKPTPAAASEMRHGPDFRSLAWGDSQYAFTPSQAAVVKVLWEARGNRTPDVGEQFIIEAVESCGSRLRDIFSKHPAWGTLIVPGQTKGTFRLAE